MSGPAQLQAENDELRAKVALLMGETPVHPSVGLFVAGERAADCVGLAENALLQTLVGVWPLVRLEWEPPEEIPDGLAIWRRWDLLWRGATLDLADLAERMGVEEDLVRRVLTRAKAARLVYPDGRVHAYAAAVLEALMRKKLGVKPKKQGAA
ncbi:MAG: hypothetical protein ABIL09_24015 [Gemmatimonadota bacterium]